MTNIDNAPNKIFPTTGVPEVGCSEQTAAIPASANISSLPSLKNHRYSTSLYVI